MSPTVVALVLVLAGTVRAAWWCRCVLADEDRYLQAVAPLGRNRVVARVSGRLVRCAVRRRGGWSGNGSSRAAHITGTVVRRAMTTRTFGRAWTAGHRAAHRTLRRNRRPAPKVAAAMLLVAASGRVVGLIGTLGPWCGTVRRRLGSV